MGTRSALRARARADEEREGCADFSSRNMIAPPFSFSYVLCFLTHSRGSREPQYCVYVSPVKNAVYTLYAVEQHTLNPSSGVGPYSYCRVDACSSCLSPHRVLNCTWHRGLGLSVVSEVGGGYSYERETEFGGYVIKNELISERKRREEVSTLYA